MDIDGEAANDYSGLSISLSADSLTVAIGARGNDATASGAGHVRVYKMISGSWIQQGADMDGEGMFDKSGYSVSMNANGLMVAIGAPSNSTDSVVGGGHVRVYKFISGTWTLQGLDIDGEAASDESGRSVSLSADGLMVAIGAPGNDNSISNSGHVRVYKFISGVWIQQGSDIDGEAISDFSGNAVALSSDGLTVAVGAEYNDGTGTHSGHVRIYKLISNVWTQLGSDIDGEAAGDRSGNSISISSDGLIVAIGAPDNNGNGSSAGHVRVYKLISGVWTKQGSDIDGEAAGDESGRSVSLSADGSMVAIGAPFNDGSGMNAGHVRVFELISGVWTQYGSDLDGESSDDRLGASVSMSADSLRLASGAWLNDGSGSNAGHVRVYAKCTPSKGIDTLTACDSLVWIDGITYSENDSTATFTLKNAIGCDSIVTLNLTVIESSASIDTQLACDSYLWIDGNTYTSSNITATDTFTNAKGCDSVITLNLTVNYSNSSTDFNMACDSFLWINGITYFSNNTTATDTFINNIGCDSVVTLNLTISNNTGIDVITACDAYVWMDGNTYTTSNNTAVDTLVNAAGCDSIVTLNLTINNSNVGTDIQFACDSMIWIDGITYTTNNNTATDTLINALGCDSIVTLNLTVGYSNAATDVRSACDSMIWIDGITYTTNNTSATFILNNASGCDSVVTLNLTIDTVDATVTNSDPIITANAFDASYQWLDCNSNYAIIAGDTSQLFIATSNGNYAVEVVMNGCKDTSDCVALVRVGVAENLLFKEVEIYPNPSQGQVNINLESLKEVSVTVYNSQGKVVYIEDDIGGSIHQIDLNVNSGFYTIELSANGIRRRYKLMIEE